MGVEYVLVYADMVPARGGSSVLIIERAKKDWQFGRMNLLGGHVEEGETPVAAGIRELLEESGIHASTPDCHAVGVMEGDGWRVHVVRCPWHEKYGGVFQLPTDSAEGPITRVPVNVVTSLPKLIPNLRLIIPLVDAGVTGWTLKPTSDDELGWSITLEPILVSA